MTVSGVPREGRLLTVTLADPDGIIANTIDWTWERSADQSDWTAFTTGVSSSGVISSYTPLTSDVGQHLRVTVAYTDGAGPHKEIIKVAAGALGYRIRRTTGRRYFLLPRGILLSSDRDRDYATTV